MTGITTLLLDGTQMLGKSRPRADHDTFVEIDGTDLGNLIGKLPAYALADAGWLVFADGLCARVPVSGKAGGIHDPMETATGRRLPHFMGFPVYLTQVLPTVTHA